ncbi:hypothetical protein BD309DRAFT_480497 [Dichomitus squalens]|nr:hypothetical protein BD309DRAFT_480497 [Dichomitus squalens]
MPCDQCAHGRVARVQGFLFLCSRACQASESVPSGMVTERGDVSSETAGTCRPHCSAGEGLLSSQRPRPAVERLVCSCEDLSRTETLRWGYMKVSVPGLTSDPDSMHGRPVR